MGYARRRARLLAAAAAVTLLAACSAGGEAPADGPTGATASDPASGPAPGTAPTEPGTPELTYAVHEVEPPGPFEPPLAGDDLLIVDDETIPEALLQQIQDVEIDGTSGVSEFTTLSTGQISVENKLYNLAAVDPAEYRRFVAEPSAKEQDVWDRVAGGEVAVSIDLKDKIPLDRNGYLAVGSGEEVHPVHVGAYADQVGTIDLVVNKAWGEALGMPEDNALLINTGTVSPQAVREEIEKLLDDDPMSITALDIVAETGIDPDTFQTVVPVGSFADAVGVFRYTPIGGGRIQPDPQWVSTHIVTEVVPILGSVTCNKYMMPQFRAALAEIQRAGLADEINPEEYAGCYYPRFIAGSTTLSNHSYGLAFDINVPGNLRGTVGEIHRGVVAIFKKWGFAWGGDWSYTDPMHFELERIVKPGSAR